MQPYDVLSQIKLYSLRDNWREKLSLMKKNIYNSIVPTYMYYYVFIYNYFEDCTSYFLLVTVLQSESLNVQEITFSRHTC